VTNVLFYDRDCGACTCVIAWLVRRAAPGTLDARAIQDDEARRLLADLPEALQLASWHSVEPDGTRRSGARVVTTPAVRDALPAALRSSPPGAVSAYVFTTPSRPALMTRLRQRIATTRLPLRLRC
jgi:hypothetical protein